MARPARSLAIGLGLVALLLAAGAGVVWAMLHEPENMAAGDLRAALFFPAAVREAPLPGACGEARLTRSLVDCGGVCGETFYIAYPSTAPQAEIAAALEAWRAAEFPAAELSVSKPEGPGCVPVLAAFTRMD